jgi:LysM repeat protein
VKRVLAALAVFAVVSSLFLIPLSLRAAIGVQGKPARAVAAATATPTNPRPIMRVHLPTPVHRSVRTAAVVVKRYVVKGGDTLWSIAQRSHVKLAVLISINRHVIGSNPNLIHTGERLLL